MSRLARAPRWSPERHSGVSADPASDRAMPFLAAALDRGAVGRQLQRCLPELATVDRVRVLSAHTLRYKPGRRCVIEYELAIQRTDGREVRLQLVGKAGARGPDRATHELLVRLRAAGFTPDSTDGVAVPRPAGIVPRFHMTLQNRAPGVPVTSLIEEVGAEPLARRVAEALRKLHRAHVPSGRRHTLEHELRILADRLRAVASLRPALAGRLEQVLAACHRLAAAMRRAPPPLRGIHRDFYPDQVLVDGPRLWLLDFDLYCEGDPALDAGNFLGHLTERSLRLHGDPDALGRQAQAFEEAFVAAAGPQARAAVRAYGLLTLARHIAISTQFPDREQTTEPLLALCEERLLGHSLPAGQL